MRTVAGDPDRAPADELRKPRRGACRDVRHLQSCQPDAAEIESAVRDVLYAADVLAERFGLSPAGARGQWEAAFDWDMSLLESSQQTFAQMSELQSRGLITGERLTQWVMGGTMEDARAEVEQAKAQQPGPDGVRRNRFVSGQLPDIWVHGKISGQRAWLVAPRQKVHTTNPGGKEVRPMQQMLFDILTAIASAAVATLLWWYFTTKRNDHGGNRDR